MKSQNPHLRTEGAALDSGRAFPWAARHYGCVTSMNGILASH